MKEIEEIDKAIKWLHANNKSSNIVQLGQALNQIATLLNNITHACSEAYGTMNELEDEYDNACSNEFVRLIKEDNSAAYATKAVGASESIQEKKRNLTQAKNVYKKLLNYRDGVDKILDTYKQYISNLKMDLKHS